jgi:manganese transport protein
MGEFVNPRWVRLLAWIAAIIIVGLNVWLLVQTTSGWVYAAGPYRNWILALVLPIGAGLGLLLLWITFEPLLSRRFKFGMRPIELPVSTAAPAAAPEYRRILVPLDHTERDRGAISHAAAMARLHNARLYLLHVEEGVTSQLYGSLSSTEEVRAGQKYVEDIVASLKEQAVDVEAVIVHARNPREQIVKYARELRPDLLVMGAHGHRWLKDLIFGNTINAVRHDLNVPLLIVRDE